MCVNIGPAAILECARILLNAERIGRETMSLPLGGALTDVQQRRVCTVLRELLGDGAPSHE